MRKRNVLVAVAVLATLAGCANRGYYYYDENGQVRSYTTGAYDENGHYVSTNQTATGWYGDAPRAVESRPARPLAAPAPRRNVANDLYPPNPRPGECYARVIIPARYEQTSERVVVRDASSKIEITPAQYETVERRVLVKEAVDRLEVVPAVYETRTERVLVTPAQTRIEEVPAVYRTETKRVVDKPAHTEWKRATGIGSGEAYAYGGAADAIRRFGDQDLVVRETRTKDTGEVMCLVEIPATYKTITKQVLVSPATTRRVDIPAEYGNIEKRVVVRRATTRRVLEPAEYTTHRNKRLVRRAQERRIPVPAQYDVVTKKKKVQDERVAWRSVLCEVNMTKRNVSQLQSALKAEGCYQCQVDGLMGECTIRGAQCYAEPRGLPYGESYVTMEVVRSLGINLE